MGRKIRMGMVGGGQGAFIGAVHRMAAALDGQIELVCGAFSSNPEKSKASGAELYLPDERVYASFSEMIIKEAQLPDHKKMDFVSIVTPNHLHFEPAKMALENGFHVVVDKPICFSLAEAKTLKNILEKTGLRLALTHNYTGYPMVKQARQMVFNKELGEIRKVMVQYPQGWLSSFIENEGQKQASWRTDPTKSGIAGAMGDIGTHAENLIEYITFLKINEICAQINTVVEGRQLDDDGNVLLKFDNGATGMLSASQIAIGEENQLTISVYGTKASISWNQMYPNDLTFRSADESMKVLRPGVGKLYPETLNAMRLPAGHPEGFIEAFANIYKNFAACIQSDLGLKKADGINEDYPTIEDGIRGMQFIEKVILSGNSEQKWIKFDS